MSLENDFLPFAAGGGANVEPQTTWASDSVIANGFQSGTANSAQVNKVLRQSSIIASMVAQFIVDQSGQPAIDNGTTATLEANLLAAINAIIATFAANALGSGGTIYSPTFDSLTTNGLDAHGAGVRLMYGNYGVLFRNDGSTLYILLTSSGNASGTFNSLRPFAINLLTGALTIDQTGAGAAFGGSVAAASLSVSGAAAAATLTITASAAIANAALTGSAATAPTPATGTRNTQIATTAMFANEFASSVGASGYQRLPSGLLIQWGGITASSLTPGNLVSVTFPIAFAALPFSITLAPDCNTPTGTSTTAWFSAVSRSATGFGYQQGSGTDFSSKGPIHTWMAIGH